MVVYYYDANGFYTHSGEAGSVPSGATDVVLPTEALTPGQAFHFNGTSWSIKVNPAFSGNSVKSKEFRIAQLISEAQASIDALLVPKSNVQHLMEATYDLWVLVNDAITQAGITLTPTGSSANTRLTARISMYGQIQAIRAARDAAIQELNNE